MKINVKRDDILIFNKEREENEVDLIKIISDMLVAPFGQVAANHMLSDVDIVAGKDKKPEVQLMFIKRYLDRVLLRYGGITNTDVSYMMSYVTSTNDVSIFMGLFNTYIFPFMVENKIYSSILGETNG